MEGGTWGQMGAVRGVFGRFCWSSGADERFWETEVRGFWRRAWDGSRSGCRVGFGGLLNMVRMSARLEQGGSVAHGYPVGGGGISKRTPGPSPLRKSQMRLWRAGAQKLCGQRTRGEIWRFGSLDSRSRTNDVWFAWVVATPADETGYA